MADNLLQELKRAGGPRVRGSQVTIYWQGERTVSLVSDLDGWEERPRRLRRLPARMVPDGEPPLWSLTVSLPRDAYFEYFYRDPVTQERLMDPFNARTVSNGFGARNNFFYMPGAAPTPLAARRSGIPHGRVTRHLVPTGWLADDGQREVHLYAPPVKGRVPLLLVYDGTDYLKRGALANLMDNLIADGRVQPVALAMVQNGGRYRGVEYSCSDATLHWLDHYVLPLARRELNLIDVRRSPGAFGVLGASLSGTMSIYTGLRMPEVFGKVISQAGAFDAEGRDFAIVDLIRQGAAREQLRMWLGIGRLDFLFADNRRMRPILKKQGYDATWQEFSGGHNYTAWRDNLPPALEAMFPGEGG